MVYFVGRFRYEHDELERALEERRAHQDELYHQAHFDDLTGLAKRVLFFDRLSQALIHAKRSGNSTALLFLDLDHFKSVNDTLGHHAGDELLRRVAQGLVSSVRAADTVGRLGGDEFAIILPSVAQREHALRIAQKVLRAVRECCKRAGKEVDVTVSVGVVLSADIVDADAEALVKAADFAMFAAKKHGRNTYQVFQPEMLVDAARNAEAPSRPRRITPEQAAAGRHGLFGYCHTAARPSPSGPQRGALELGTGLQP